MCGWFRTTVCVIASAFLCLPLVLRAEKPVVVIDKKNRFDIYVTPISGEKGAKATWVLENDLKMSGSFNLVSQDEAEFIANGQLASDGCIGFLTPRGKSMLFSKLFKGDWRRATHLFADEIIQAVTGSPGFASSRIAFISSQTGSKEVYVMDMDGSNVRQLTNDKTISLGPKWSPDATRLAYTSYRSNYPDVWVVDLDKGRQKRVAYYPGLNAQPAWSPDGKRLALALSKDGNTELYTMNADGGNLNRLTRTRGTEASPCWSPDGKHIAYVSDDRGSAQLFILPADGKGKPRRVKTTAAYSTEPAWSPDGKKLACSLLIAGQSQIAMIDLASGEQTLLTNTSNNETPSWTRNSRHLVYTHRGDVYLLDSLTKQSLHIKNGLNRNSEPHCSP